MPDDRTSPIARASPSSRDQGGRSGIRFYLPYDVATIGRSDANTVVLQESMASRVHAEIGFDGRDFAVTDRNSTNGPCSMRSSDERAARRRRPHRNRRDRLKFHVRGGEAAARDQ